LTRFERRITDAEKAIGHSRTVVIGDFNMNPFESGVVGSEGFHAIMARAIAAQETRTVLGEDRHFFYNPMWSLLGDMSVGPPGTYYYQSSAPVSYFWHMFDQVLLRPSLAHSLQRNDLAILTEAGDQSLLDRHGRPDRRVSDHLPIFIRLNVEE
jgi:endonuclease/exonuclease/phosphatase family metal-dependent hydrolase